MSRYKWYLPTFGEIMALEEPCLRQRDLSGDRSALQEQPHSTRPQREWYGAVAGLNDVLERSLDTSPTLSSDGAASPVEGLVISGPLPVLSRARLIAQFSSWMLTGSSDSLHSASPQLPAASDMAASAESAIATLSLMADDPLAAEPFCLVLTADFSLVMALSPHVLNESPVSCSSRYAQSNRAQPDSRSSEHFMFSFTPEVVWQCWRSLRSRLGMTAPHVVAQLDTLVQQFAPVTPDYRLVSDFSRLMLANIPDPETVARSERLRQSRQIRTAVRRSPVQSPPKKLLNLNLPKPLQDPASFWKASYSQLDPVLESPWDVSQRETAEKNSVAIPAAAQTSSSSSMDAELLQAIAHEVRTPLTTIRTMTRLLLRRNDLPEQVTKRLAVIDRECTRQIDRFGLIFRAVELETQPADAQLSPLATISLDQMFRQNMARWQQQAEQHNLTLDVMLPQALPSVLSDPTMLDQVLTGLIDRLTHTLPSGSHIEMKVMLAGNQLKLQFYSRFDSDSNTVNEGSEDFSIHAGHSIFDSTLQSVGQLLMFQPETGNLSLNLDVTKNLFQALGGKFTVRQYPQQGEVLTIFLPLDERSITV